MSRQSRYAHLLSPGAIGSMTLPNRVVMPAMDQNLCDDEGLLVPANLDHYEQRAAGGVGLVIVETSAVSYPVGATSRHQPNLATDACIEGFAELARRVHEHGSRVIVQICHHGKTAGVDTVEERPLLVPSLPLPPMNPMGLVQDLTGSELMAMAGRMQGKRPSFEAATADQLAEVVDAFGAAAGRMHAAGCDGVEIHAAHGYLLSTFLSPHWNRRDDAYGGDLEGRTRLLAEVVRSVRAATSDDFAIVVRLDGTEFGVDDGITPELAAEHARAAQAAGADAVHVSAMGAPDSGVAFTDGPLPWRPLQYRDLARTVKAAVSVPVIAVGRISPADGDDLIGSGDADFVAMGRQSLADPETVARLVEGRPDLVRPCINCFVCVAENFWDATPRCAVNARLGRRPGSRPETAVTSRHVVVVGGGPAGLELARVAAGRGHRVTLLERARHLGGTARFSSLTTPVNGEFVDYLVAAVTEAGVDVRTGVTATVDTVGELAPDVVVVATGAVRHRPDVPGADADHVLSGDDLRGMLTGDDPEALRRFGPGTRALLTVGSRLGLTTRFGLVRRASSTWLPLGERVVVVGGGLVGTELAEFLAERGRRVVVLEPGGELAPEMAHPRRWRTLHEARSHGVRFVTGAELAEITATQVVYTVDGAERRVDADQVLLAAGIGPDDSLARTLADAGHEVHTIGDAAEVGYIEGAVRTGHDLACEL